MAAATSGRTRGRGLKDEEDTGAEGERASDDEMDADNDESVAADVDERNAVVDDVVDGGDVYEARAAATALLESMVGDEGDGMCAVRCSVNLGTAAPLAPNEPDGLRE